MAAGPPAQRRTEVARDGAQPLLSVRGLGIRFKTTQGIWQATRRIDFDIAPGERVGIVGESGCGKTITGLSILRLLPGNFAGLDGKILFDGTDLASCSARQMRAIRGKRIAMIFQEPMSALDPVFTVGHQIAETLRAIPMSATRKPAPKRWRCSASSASPRRSGGSTTIRTSSPAACASA
ncbi:ABC-type microcin C transport system duplicated ATPase subunit YejF [Bradyrhizobium embrapense]